MSARKNDAVLFKENKPVFGMSQKEHLPIKLSTVLLKNER